MKTNVGQNDQILRLTLALIIGLGAFLMGQIWGFIALYPLITAIFRFDPLYLLIGTNTKSAPRHLGSKKQRTNHKNHY